jgi:biotin carboxyl carrier protein
MPENPFQITVNDKSFEVHPNEAQSLDIVAVDKNAFHILKNNKAYSVEVISRDKKTKTYVFNINGTRYSAKVSDKYDRLIDQLGMKVKNTHTGGNIKAPMPGLVLEVSIEVGQSIVKGDKVLILEAMKMENVIKAPGDGIAKAIHISKGVAVEKGQLLIEVE